MTSAEFRGPEYYRRPTRRTGSAGRPDDDPDIVARFEDFLQAGQTPRQQELARAIYDRLYEGADVEDVKDLIDDMSRIATEDAPRPRRDQPRD